MKVCTFMTRACIKTSTATAPAKMVSLRSEAEKLLKVGNADGALTRYRSAMAELVGSEFADEMMPWIVQRNGPHGFRSEKIVQLNQMHRVELMGLCVGMGDCFLKKADRVRVRLAVS
jgi:hypothetical protein